MLTAQEEARLAVMAQSGDTVARDSMVAENFALVKYHALRYVHMGHSLTLEDLIQEGCIGMLHAVRKYDPDKGRFGSYASLWIKQAIRFAVYSNWGPLKVPIWTRSYLPRFRQVREDLGRGTTEPTPEAIGQAMGIGTSKVKAIACAEVTLSQWAADESGARPTLGETLLEHAGDGLRGLIQGEDVERCRGLLDRLPEREGRIIRLRFGLDGQAPRSLSAVGRLLNLTAERVRVIELGAVQSLYVGMRESVVPEAALRQAG